MDRRAANVDDSSLDVIAYWDVGVQVVPLSAPVGGPQMHLGSGKFLLNGNCGYILKPRRLRLASDALRTPLDAPPRKLLKLQIKIHG